jgi:hypothetical protein
MQQRKRGGLSVTLQGFPYGTTPVRIALPYAIRLIPPKSHHRTPIGAHSIFTTGSLTRMGLRGPTGFRLGIPEGKCRGQGRESASAGILHGDEVREARWAACGSPRVRPPYAHQSTRVHSPPQYSSGTPADSIAYNSMCELERA